jgi:hypothetical protein
MMNSLIDNFAHKKKLFSSKKLVFESYEMIYEVSLLFNSR